jgi:putative chitinase
MAGDFKFFTVSEFLITGSGLNNVPPAGSPAWDNLYRLMHTMDQVRETLGKPVRITSGYRSPAVNAAIGGSKTSDHMAGLACDFVAGDDPLIICQRIIDSGLEFDQLIAEFRGDAKRGGAKWVHLGIGPRMRGQVLTYRDGKYLTGLQP